MFSDLKLLQKLQGGSKSLTAVFEDDLGQYFVRKMAPLPQASKLIYQANWLKQFQMFSEIPRVLRAAYDDGFFILDLNYYSNAETLSHAYLNEDLNSVSEALGQMLSFAQSKLHLQSEIQYSDKLLADYFDSKVYQKIEQCRFLVSKFESFLVSKTVVINGKEYLNVLPAFQEVLRIDNARRALKAQTACLIHGDLTFENILLTNNGVVLLDPNDENILSDPAVEFGKLLQSVHGNYEQLAQARIQIQGPQQCVVHVEAPKIQAELLKMIESEIVRRHGPLGVFASYFHETVHFVRLLPYKARLGSGFIPYFSRAVQLVNELKERAEQLGR